MEENLCDAPSSQKQQKEVRHAVSKKAFAEKEKDLLKREGRLGIEYGKIEQMRRSLSSRLSSMESQLSDLKWKKENVEKLLEEKTRECRELVMAEERGKETEERLGQLIHGVETFLNDSESPLSGPCLQLKETLQKISNEGNMKTSLPTVRLPKVRKFEREALKIIRPSKHGGIKKRQKVKSLTKALDKLNF